MSKTVQPPIDFDVDFDAPIPEDKPLHARRTDPETAHEGAEAGNENFPTVQDKILDALRTVPEGLTTEELSERTDIHLKSVSPMMKPMEKHKLVYRDPVGLTVKGKQSYRKRKNRSGKSAIIWYAVKGA
jgi:hypothetical protein